MQYVGYELQEVRRSDQETEGPTVAKKLLSKLHPAGLIAR